MLFYRCSWLGHLWGKCLFRFHGMCFYFLIALEAFDICVRSICLPGQSSAKAPGVLISSSLNVNTSAGFSCAVSAATGHWDTLLECLSFTLRFMPLEMNLAYDVEMTRFIFVHQQLQLTQPFTEKTSFPAAWDTTAISHPPVLWVYSALSHGVLVCPCVRMPSLSSLPVFCRAAPQTALFSDLRPSQSCGNRRIRF